MSHLDSEPPAPAAVRLYRIRNAADLLDVSERYVWQLLADGVLRRVEQGSRVYVRDDDIAGYINQRTTGGEVA